ncbi:MAG: ABC transporter substrate-binding protein [Thermomicrobiales bacterium]
MSALSSLIQELTTGKLTRRQFLERAAALGVSAPLAARLAAQPEAAVAQATPVGTPTGSPTAGGPPGPAVDKVGFSAFNVDQAPKNIENGDMDLYLFGLKTTGAKSLEGNQNVRLIQAPASTLALILNPAPAPQGDLNPFSIPQVRQAMQYLVDRDFIANDIYQGRALPMTTNVSPLDYDAITIFPVTAASDIRHDAEFAKQTIATAMQGAGAQLQKNVWSLNGKPIAIKLVTRVEDERRDIGDTVRAALEGVGFQVQPLYQQFGPATLAVYASDPITFQWHIYTEGWGRSSPNRYDDSGVNFYYAPWLGNMPGWQESGFWQYQQQELDDLGKKLYRGEFKSRDERDDIFRQMTTTGINESVRIWLVTALQSFPVRNEVKDLTEDLVAGPKNLFALRGADIPGRNDIKVGHLWIWTERTTWNPIGGFGDVYSTDIYRNIVDAAVVNHPFTGLPVPMRADFKVETAGPDGNMPVPEDAVVWDAKQDAWVKVKAGTTAVSKVTYDYSKYTNGTWHHGPKITLADVVYPIAQAYEIAYDEAKIQIETALGITSRPTLETFKGYRIADDHTIEVYVDYWHFEPAYIASYGVPSSVATPWELLAAMDDVVYQKRRGAYSDTAAARFSVPWLSLVTESDARLVLRSVAEFKRGKTIPKGYFDINGQSLVSAIEAAERYDAAEAWFKKTNLLVISNGPFVLARYDPPAQYAELHAFREKGYPFTAGNFRLGQPPHVTIAPIQAPSPQLGEPIQLTVQVSGPGTLSLQYALVDPSAGEIVPNGSGNASGDANGFTVNIDSSVTSGLFPGLYQLYLAASSDQVAEVAAQRLDLQIGV